MQRTIVSSSIGLGRSTMADDEHDLGRDVGLFRQRDEREMMISQMWHVVLLMRR
jgi:hypothetical protein